VSWLSRMANVFRSSAVDRALDEEMQFHIDARVDDLVATGMTRQAAEVAASRQFGSRLRLRESSRDVKLLPWVESVFKDIRFALRMFRKHTVVTVAAIASLTLALGASLAAFSLIDALILRPLPVREPERLVYLSFPTYSPDPPIGTNFSYPLFSRLRGRRETTSSSSRQATRTGAGSRSETPKRKTRCAFDSSPATRSLFWASSRLSGGC